MNIILNNHTEEYAVREIVNAYFPKIQVRFVDSANDDEDFVYTEYLHIDNRHIYICRCKIAGEFKEVISERDTYNKTYLKKIISACLAEITGIHLPWGVLTGIRPSKIVREYKLLDKTKEECMLHLTDFYETDYDKARLAVEVEETESVLLDKMYDDGISLYIGIPFCPTRCLYCSFTSQSIQFSNKLTNEYVICLKKEIEKVSQMEYVKNRRVETVYLGGGTPSALTAEQIDDILCCLYSNFDFGYVKEITFEAGRPDTITEEKLNVLKKYNISRISINPQTVNDNTLKLIGRNHTTEDFIKSFELAKAMGFSHINCDVIAGLPGESVADFQKTMYQLKELSPESITVHTMCIKHGSYLDMKHDMYTLSTAETVNTMLADAEKIVRSDEKIPYYMYRQKNMLGNLENVGYCSVGHECLYNIYIMEEVQSIIALGAGGSTKIVDKTNIERVFNVKEVSEYIKRIDEMIERKQVLFNNY